jgi:hypothetical protein
VSARVPSIAWAIHTRHEWGVAMSAARAQVLAVGVLVPRTAKRKHRTRGAL